MEKEVFVQIQCVGREEVGMQGRRKGGHNATSRRLPGRNCSAAPNNPILLINGRWEINGRWRVVGPAEAPGQQVVGPAEAPGQQVVGPAEAPGQVNFGEGAAPALSSTFFCLR